MWPCIELIIFIFVRSGTYTIWLNNLFCCKQDKTRTVFSQFAINSNKFRYTVNVNECYHLVW
jgi:hypothetical protein